jgi:putative selenium metabolism hydrolase
MTYNLDQLIQFMQALIRIQSLSGHEQPLIDRVAVEMNSLGYDQVFTDANGSLIGLIEGVQTGPTLLLDAHCDTVGVAPGVAWQHDPFSAVIADERVYGRGSSDMKGALGAMVYAAAAADRSRLTGRVAVSVTVLEEVMEGVALGTVMDEVQPDYVVIGESTNLNLNHGGRGRAEIHLEAIGRPAHSSTPHLGVNAVHLMLAAVQAIEAMPLPSDPLLGEAIMALTDIISDPYPGYSVIPSRCRVTYDRRLLAGETMAGVVQAIQNLPSLENINVTIAQGEHTAYTGANLSGPKFFPAWKFSADHPFVQAALAGLQSAGLHPKMSAYRFCTNGAYSAGHANVPTIGFGPSAEGQAHVVDEYIELTQLEAAARGYLGIIEHVLSL